MPKYASIPRGAQLEGASLSNHLRAVSAECHVNGRARLRGIRANARALEVSLAVLRARHEAEELTPAALWLVDNARLIEEACVSLREELRGAPSLPAASGEARIDRLVGEWLSHVDARADGDSLCRAVSAWQAIAPLTEMELSLLPLAVRRALVSLLSDLAASGAETERERTHAEAALDIRAHRRPDAYWERLTYLLQEREDLAAVAALDERLLALGTTATEVAAREHERQTRACLWTSNAIASLRVMSMLEWREHLQSLSIIDQWLRKDPAAVYGRMDFASRSMYRRRAARLAARFRLSEGVVAQKTFACAEAGAKDTVAELARHVGYYLLDEGQPLLWKALGKAPLSLRLARAVGRRAAPLYTLGILLGSTGAAVLLYLLGMGSWLAGPALLAAGEGFRQLSGLLIHRLSPPRCMPRLAPDKLEDGGVLVVVPALLTSRGQALEMTRHLSVLRLANPESRLSYMLLGDFHDSLAAVDPGDAEITGAAQSAVSALNDVWNGGFYYLHRAREWNKNAGRFMGYERKRGALMALNELLITGECDAHFAAASCDPSRLQGMFDWVVTLDADTQLPPGTALELAGMLQHPLNRPCETNGKRRGCAVIQPRMETAAATIHTRIARYWGGDGGFDPYITAFSDVYQNLCGEGSFAGKGVYHVRAFMERSEGLIPDNTVLSHDLLEGGLTGASLACDVALYDSQPASFSAWMKRLHRWTRGDWQLLPWLLPWIRRQNRWIRNPLSMLSQFKIYDNLRRSLVPAAAVLLIIAGVWAGAPAAVLSGLFLPYVRALLPVSKKSLVNALTHLALLPYEAALLLDAAFRTLWRLLISRRRLLEWLPSAEAERQRPTGSLLRFWPNYAAAAALAFSALCAPVWFVAAGPLSLVWAFAPLTAKWLDAPVVPPLPVTDKQKEMLEDIARRTFRFFEETVTEATNHLPPDNLQLEPPRGIAPRTSPTNIGMYLLSCVSACELTLLDADTMARRIEKTVSAMERMETWHGHPYNWYDVRTLKPLPRHYVSSVDGGNLAGCLLLAAQAVRNRLEQVDASLLSLPARLDALAAAMDFSRLYDPERGLFYVGVNAEIGAHSDAHYDLLASEARLLSFIALMRREAPLRHWRKLGRAMTKTARGATLLSWSGTMFEYLLPMLFLKSPHGTLLGDASLHAAAEQARAFGGGPWGVSESGYYAFDPTLSYQYRAFGLPSLALRSARPERVIAPYASALALGVLPREAAENLRLMAEIGWLGDLGFYEAADYEGDRLARGRTYAIVRSHMAHHQGMIIASICNLLTGGALTRYFHSLPQAEAYALLLEERRPSRAMLRGAAKPRKVESIRRQDESLLRHVTTRAFPWEAQVLFGGGTTMVCDARGGGYISHNGLLLTRRRLDPLYVGGVQLYLRFPGGDVLRMQGSGAAWFDRSRAAYRREHGGLTVELTCFVSPLDGAAMHLLRLTASSGQDVEVEAASFFEVCLSAQAADESHPAFMNLAIETKRLSDTSALAWRRPRNQREEFPLLLHAVGMDNGAAAQLETSRPAFLGRGERLENPLALMSAYDPARGETGAVLDPCMSLRVPLHINAGTTASVWFVTAAAQDEEKARALAAQYAGLDPILRALELSATQDEVTAKYLGLDNAGSLTAQRLSSWLIHPFSPRHAPKEGRAGLWPFSISGDLPVILVRVSSEAHFPLARAALKAHAYLRAMGLWSDLALLCEEAGGYHHPLRDALRALVASSPSRDLTGQGAGVHLIDAGAEQAASQILSGHAAVELRGGQGSLAAQLSGLRRALPVPKPVPAKSPPWPKAQAPAPGNLAFDNGYGGFRADGGYVIYGQPPAPWCNVLANPCFGAVVTDRGGGFTWKGNSRLRRLTALASDPVRDQRCEALWVRDEASGQFVNPFDDALVTHGFGFSRFESQALGLTLALDVFVDAELPVKCYLLEIKNPGDRTRQVTVTGAARWLLGSLWEDASHVNCAVSGNVALATSPAFEETAFLAMPGRQAEVSVGGAGFFGEGGMEDPLGMRLPRLEPGRDMLPCGILRVSIPLPAHSTEAVVLLLGAGDPGITTQAYANGGAQLRLNHLRVRWQQRLAALIPRVPDAAASLMLGLWAPYQALSSRVFAHAGFYQAGGAIGFRDQLQDVLAFRFTQPMLVREHLLDAAAHQFEEGDVQHWWHPPALGVRTRITDDRLFLPYVTALYLGATEDLSVLTEEVPYLRNVAFPEGNEDWYGLAQPSQAIETLHEHNLRALNSVRLGSRGLPLMGGGDWNDGMNGVGAEGKGESVWLGFFLCVVLQEYAAYCAPDKAAELLTRRGALLANLEEHAWDGGWYLRAWYDDGTPLGGKECEECRIDLLAQAWAVLAGAERGARAFDAALEHLLDEKAGILKLLDPPFDGKRDPGYIRAYPKGIRENGGQYTHAAIWFIMAAAKLGRFDLAWKLFFMILPISHSQDTLSARRYLAEPYVMAGDVAAGARLGRGGWSWYTGSASLLWSLGIETLLGFEKRGARLRLRPTAPAGWEGYAIEYRYGGTTYLLRALRGEAVPPPAAQSPADGGWIDLVDDGGTHEAVFLLES